MTLTRSRSDIYALEDRATLGSDPSAKAGNRQPNGSGPSVCWDGIQHYCDVCGYNATCPVCLSPKAQTPGPEGAEPSLPNASREARKNQEGN